MQSISETRIALPLRTKIVALIFSVLLMTAAFPPLDLGFLGWIGLAPIFAVIVCEPRARRAFKWAYMFGCLHWGWTIIWIAATVNAWTHSWAGWGAWIGLTLLKSLWFGLFGVMAWWLTRRQVTWQIPVLIASAWTFMEWLRCQTGVAMPWSLTGYTQYRWLSVIQIADITGVFGITFLLAYLNSSLALILLGMRNIDLHKWTVKCSLRSLIAPASLILITIAYGQIKLRAELAGPSMRISIIQPNDRTMKDVERPSDTELMERMKVALVRYRRMNDEASADKPVLIIWPESTAPFSAFKNPEVSSAWSEFARSSSAWHLVGSDNPVDEHHSYNSAAIFDPQGQLAARYDKTWLVPMGEWFPLRFIPGLQQAFNFPEDAAAGKGDQLISINDMRASVLICYESVFPVIAAGRAARGANLLINITNDSWAGESSELQQHVAMSAMRCVETRRWMASSATTGITGFISPTGEIGSLPSYKEGRLTKDVPLLSEVTIYSRIGDAFVGSLVLLIVCSVAFRKRGGVNR